MQRHGDHDSCRIALAETLVANHASKMGDYSECDHPVESREHSIRIWVWGVLSDWRYWAVAIVCSILGACVSSIGSGMGWTAAYIGGGATAGLGIYVALTLGRISRCGECGKIVRAPLLSIRAATRRPSPS